MKDVKDITILVVDDDTELRETITIEFEMLGFRVLSANNANEALELIKKYPPHVMITDMLMPGGGGTGVQLLERVEIMGVMPPITFLMTGFADMLEGGEELQSKIEAIFEKPFARMDLVEAVLVSLEPLLGKKITTRRGNAA